MKTRMRPQSLKINARKAIHSQCYTSLHTLKMEHVCPLIAIFARPSTSIRTNSCIATLVTKIFVSLVCTKRFLRTMKNGVTTMGMMRLNWWKLETNLKLIGRLDLKSSNKVFSRGWCGLKARCGFLIGHNISSSGVRLRCKWIYRLEAHGCVSWKKSR